MNDKKVYDFMWWLDLMIEELEYDEDMEYKSTHELHQQRGRLRALRMVEDKCKELGFKKHPHRRHLYERGC